MLDWLLAFVLFVAQSYLLLAALHLYFPLAGALAGRARPRAPLAPTGRPLPRLAVLIAAHNEGAVIAGALAALANQHYEKSAYDVFVVADNCTDDTAERARRAGATVLERATEGGSTKGKALAWLWERVPAGAYGGVAVLDADNHAEPRFLSVIAAELAAGRPVVQGLRRAKAGPSRGTAGLDALTELCTHRVGAAGRRHMGLNGPIMGSGVGYAAGLFERLIRDVGETVVEDCEWQARLALEGVEVHWTPHAVVCDEKTASSAALGTQRQRWVAGRAQVARAYGPRLLAAGLTRGNLSALDMAVFLYTPPRVLALGGFAALFALGLAVPGLSGLWPAAVWFACLALFALYVLAGLALDGAPPRAYLALLTGMLQLPRFAFTMAIAAWKALTGAAVRWVPTPHGRT